MKGIVLKPWEAEAFLSGRKSRITRIIKNQPPEEMPEEHNVCRMPLFTKDGMKYLRYMDTYQQSPFKQIRWWECMEPHSVGDILYGKETWCNINKPDIKPEYAYFADTLESEDYDPSEWVWRSSMHMPFEAARIFLRVTAVKAERLHDIGIPGQHDAFLKEGITYKYGQSLFNAFLNRWNRDHTNCIYASNPWVWVCEVEQISKEEAYAKS